MSAGPPMRQTYRPVPLCVVRTPEQAAARVITRVAEILRAKRCGAFLYIAPDRTVYVLHEEHTAAQLWLRGHFDWLVGFYSTVKKPGIPKLEPTLLGVTEDIADHLRPLRLHGKQAG